MVQCYNDTGWQPVESSINEDRTATRLSKRPAPHCVNWRRL